ncbi:exodeoxyribonuclease III [Kineococcus radiotolerans]|uniref:Exodeoxyribonuclease III Xth n=1 Tax=Kineococcus radiotolerans (strain ATCC BAA-149 / DSM 14245 / SRS30216) TaxID=266940 RepID=A6WF53_KINRD|nr:exodeoxyribonuclease III [Kineococcus radiotolerans]ABS05442.1 exodeoxyribonuclease III Xth [Kineococcus radiotolerans SRS30216 = ATCC BAA-149]
MAREKQLLVATVNVNGVRAAVRRGMHSWLDARDPDVLLLQEVRAPDAELRKALPSYPHVAHTEAAAKGRAGVAVATRSEFTAVRIGFAHDPHFETSGRWIEVDVDTAIGPMTLVSTYVHSGEVGTPQQEDKHRFLDAMDVRFAELGAIAAETGREALVAGDLNVGHTERDIKNWKGNRGKAGFLEDERAHFDHWFGDLGWVDTQREVAGDVDGPYAWWSWRGQAFDNDTGWRIDYQLVTPGLGARLQGVETDRAASYAERFSDHAPVVATYRA